MSEKPGLTGNSSNAPSASAIAAQFREFNPSDPTKSPAAAADLLIEGLQKCPVPHSQELGGFHLILKDRDVRSAMTDWKTYANSPSVIRPLARSKEEEFRFPPLDFDPPENTFWRQLFVSIVNAKAAERIKDRLRAEITAILDGMAERGHGDFSKELAEVIPARAICLVLGIDDPDSQAYVFQINKDFLLNITDLPARMANLSRMADFGWAEVEARRAEPRDDALTELGLVERDGQRLSKSELGALLNSMLAAGSGTTASALADLAHEVMTRPGLRDSLLQDRALIPKAVEESLRLHAPFMGLFRRTTRAVTVQGTDLSEGESVLMCWQSANLDPASYADPLEFRLDRDLGRHMSFGLGRHACPGSPLARMELNVFLEILLDRHPNMTLAEGAKVERRFIGANAAAIETMPVIFPQ